MKTASDILDQFGITYKDGSHGFYIKKGDYEHAEHTFTPSKELALIRAYQHGVIKIDSTRIVCHEQSFPIGMTNPLKELRESGLIVLSVEYDSFGPVYFVDVVKHDVIELPGWANYMK